MKLRVRPSSVDSTAWELAGVLPSQVSSAARSALVLLAHLGQSTDLNCEIDVRALRQLSYRDRWSLRRLWKLGIERGFRIRPVPGPVTRYSTVAAEGIDSATVAFVRDNSGALSTHVSWIWYWLRELVRHGLPTSLDVDLEVGPVADLWQELFIKASRDMLDGPHPDSQLTKLKSALRALYARASDREARRRPVPHAIADSYDLRGNTARLRSLLPIADQERLQLLFDELHARAALQQAGRWQRRGRWKDTRAPTTLHGYQFIVNALIAHAIGAGWKLELDELLACGHLVEFVRRGHRKEGSPMHPFEPKRRRRLLAGLFQMAIEVDQPLLNLKGIDELNAALDGDRKPANVERRAESKRTKFIPTREQLRDAIDLIEEDYRRAVIKYRSHRISKGAFHRALQRRTMFQLSFRGMWRNDTAATINLLRARRDASGCLLVDGVRAKETGDDHHVQIVLPPEMVDFLEELLAFEGRTIEEPLPDRVGPERLRAEYAEVRNGHRVVVRAGDRWGHDRLMNDDLAVANIWRRHPDSVEGMSYGQVVAMRDRIIRRIGWFGATSHTFRSAGALYWRMRGWSDEQIMRLGLWRDRRTLLECYARLSEKDQLIELAALAPSSHGRGGKAVSDRRRSALREIQHVATEILFNEEKSLSEYERVASALRRSVDTVDQANAVERGKAWTPPEVPRVSADDLIAIDEVLRAATGYSGGLRELLRRDVLASERTATSRRAAVAEARPSARVARLIRELNASVQRPAKRSARA